MFFAAANSASVANAAARALGPLAGARLGVPIPGMYGGTLKSSNARYASLKDSLPTVVRGANVVASIASP